MAYGTPAASDDVEAYYTHIRRGRPPSADQLADLIRRYDALGGSSTLAARTAAQVAAIAAHLDKASPGQYRVALGNKHAAPFIEDAVADLAGGDTTVGNVVGLVLAPHHSRASVGEYQARAAEAAAEAGIGFTPILRWHDQPAYRHFLAAAVRDGLAGLATRTEVLFTAHSLPERALVGDSYPDELAESARAAAVAAGLASEPGPPRDGLAGWSLAWQSAGATPDPWRGPDVREVIAEIAANGRADVVLVCPQGFVSDHLEVAYDLDIEAAAVAAEAGLGFARTRVVNDDPAVMSALADLVRSAAGS